METQINNSSGNKPRYDGGGSEFGLIHRELPKHCGMFDFDRMSAKAFIDLELTKSDVGFMEYRTNFNKSDVDFVALFEIKHKSSVYVERILECKVGTAVFAQMKLCEKLGARYFIVIANNGNQPFTFYELTNGFCSKVGVLDFIDRHFDGKDAINNFWKNVLKLI